MNHLGANTPLSALILGCEHVYTVKELAQRLKGLRLRRTLRTAPPGPAPARFRLA